MKRVPIYSLVLLSSAMMLLLSACGADEPAALATTATSSHTGALPAVHMELKRLNSSGEAVGRPVCKVYGTDPSARPVVENCPDGEYIEQLFNAGWGRIGTNKRVTVGSTSNPSPATSSHTGAAAAVHMQLKNDAGTIVCFVYDTPASERPTAQNCPSGTWTEQLFDGSWKQIRPDKPVTVPGGTATPEDEGYERIFTEDFSGSSLSGDWETPSWAGEDEPEGYRPAIFRRDQCVVSGGSLTVKATLDGDQVRSCYAHTTQTFGPGSGQLKIQYKVNLSRVQAEGGWFAAWLNTLSSEGDPYDNDLSTGTEIDVMEYVPFEGAYLYDPEDGIDTRNSFHPAVHTGSDDPDGGIIIDPDGNGFYDVGSLNINLRSGYHTFGLEWNATCQVFSINGQPIWTNYDGVSAAQVHRLMLTMEMDNAGDDGYNLWGFASGRFADNLRTSPAEAQVDWVTVDRKSTPDANLCNR